MSEQQAAPMLTNDDLQTAYSNIEQQVHGRAFLHRMAQLGHVAHNEKEAAALLKIGKQLLDRYGPDEMLAEPPSGRYAVVSRLLDQPQQQTKAAAANYGSDDEAVAIAHELMQHPTIYASAAVVKQAQLVQAAHEAGLL